MEIMEIKSELKGEIFQRGTLTPPSPFLHDIKQTCREFVLEGLVFAQAQKKFENTKLEEKPRGEVHTRPFINNSVLKEAWIIAQKSVSFVHLLFL